MSREKQTKELIDVLNAWGISEYIPHHTEIAMLAHYIVSKDYHKQSEGEWIVDDKYKKTCPICGKEALYRASGTAFATTFYQTKSDYCPNCGAHLITKPKGGAE